MSRMKRRAADEGEEEATGGRGAITFLTKPNGERALFLEIDDSLLDNTGPGDENKQKNRKEVGEIMRRRSRRGALDG